ncbi:helix-turn-helix transcriptional regulator [Vibrio sp. TBV020]|uniref:helix-turn-helix transcriptional regulator n=1 Tax=Vibrio sp. TBV020 TaxID=3137398 RepID=UPI0038CD588A
MSLGSGSIMSGNSITQGYRLIRLDEVRDIVGLSRATIYRFIKQGDFPKQISLGGRAVAWDEREVFDWVEQRLMLR